MNNTIKLSKKEFLARLRVGLRYVMTSYSSKDMDLSRVYTVTALDDKTYETSLERNGRLEEGYIGDRDMNSTALFTIVGGEENPMAKAIAKMEKMADAEG